ncbi:unnamed protein product [Allacma fusca]|uniref:Uncharacterized protein n=1 Tax=Allacma fusca TaxID=39272 RepID=A0A8J2JKT4_9HEXA|nr:unnamed protein product [Allacma fusca]
MLRPNCCSERRYAQISFVNYDMSEKINSWEDMKLKVELEKDPNNLKNIKKQVQNELDKIDWDHVKEKGDFETRLRISEKKKEYEEVESELEAGINQ